MGRKDLRTKGPGVWAKHFGKKSKGVTGATYVIENIHQGGPDNDITIEQKIFVEKIAKDCENCERVTTVIKPWCYRYYSNG